MPPPAASPMTLKRIHREVADLKKEDLGAMTLAPSEDNLFLWKGQIPGPEGSVYEGGIFHLDVTLATDYPFTAPKVTLKTRIYHMNISERGDICIDILKHNWSPALSLFKVLLSLSSLLTDPNPRDPLVGAIANQYTTNRKLHDATARNWTELYAKPPPPPPPPPAAATSNSKANSTSVASSTRARGKAKAAATVTISADTSSSSSSTSRSALATVPDTIMIEDSDNEVEGSRSKSSTNRASGSKRKRAAGTSNNSNRDAGAEDEDDAEVRSSKRVATGSNRRSNHESEVIVIESDND